MSFFTKCFKSNTATPAVKQVAKAASTAVNVKNNNTSLTDINNKTPSSSTAVNNNNMPLEPQIQKTNETNLDYIRLNNMSLKEFNVIVDIKAQELVESKIKNYEKSDVFKKLVHAKAIEIMKPNLEAHIKAHEIKQNKIIEQKSIDLATVRYNTYVENFLKQKEAEYSKKIEYKANDKVEQYLNQFSLRLPKIRDLKQLQTSKDINLNSLIMRINYKIFMANYNKSKYVLLNKCKDFGPSEFRQSFQKIIIDSLSLEGYLINEHEEIVHKDGNVYKTSYWKISWDCVKITDLIE